MNPRSPSKFTHLQKVLSTILVVTFLTTTIISPAMAQSFLPVPSPVAITPAFSPVMMRGVMIHPEDSLKFDFIIDKGINTMSDDAFNQEANKLIKYFLASLTIPEKEMWVNLSPYEKDRIIPNGFGQTEMGRDLLAQDYMLKQLTASLLAPEDKTGSEFWKRVRAKAKEKFGSEDVPMDTFNKIWIVPQEANVYENEKGAFIVNTHLNVMLEEDYLALEENKNSAEHGLGHITKEDLKPLTQMQTQVIREVILPEIEKEVNEGKTFANLRQIYYSMVLATWYKQALKESLLGKVYVDQTKTDGVNINDPKEIEAIYNQYIDAFKKGAAGLIKEEYDPKAQQVISRKYMTGGANMVKKGLRRERSLAPDQNMLANSFVMVGTTIEEVKSGNAAMTAMYQYIEILERFSKKPAVVNRALQATVAFKRKISKGDVSIKEANAYVRILRAVLRQKSKRIAVIHKPTRALIRAVEQSPLRRSIVKKTVKESLKKGERVLIDFNALPEGAEIKVSYYLLATETFVKSQGLLRWKYKTQKELVGVDKKQDFGLEYYREPEGTRPSPHDFAPGQTDPLTSFELDKSDPDVVVITNTSRIAGKEISVEYVQDTAMLGKDQKSAQTLSLERDFIGNVRELREVADAEYQILDGEKFQKRLVQLREDNPADPYITFLEGYRSTIFGIRNETDQTIQLMSSENGMGDEQLRKFNRYLINAGVLLDEVMAREFVPKNADLNKTRIRNIRQSIYRVSGSLMHLEDIATPIRTIKISEHADVSMIATTEKEAQSRVEGQPLTIKVKKEVEDKDGNTLVTVTFLNDGAEGPNLQTWIMRPFKEEAEYTASLIARFLARNVNLNQRPEEIGLLPRWVNELNGGGDAAMLGQPSEGDVKDATSLLHQYTESRAEQKGGDPEAIEYLNTHLTSHTDRKNTRVVVALNGKSLLAYTFDPDKAAQPFVIQENDRSAYVLYSDVLFHEGNDWFLIQSPASMGAGVSYFARRLTEDQYNLIVFSGKIPDELRISWRVADELQKFDAIVASMQVPAEKGTPQILQRLRTLFTNLYLGEQMYRTKSVTDVLAFIAQDEELSLSEAATLRKILENPNLDFHKLLDQTSEYLIAGMVKPMRILTRITSSGSNPQLRRLAHNIMLLGLNKSDELAIKAIERFLDKTAFNLILEKGIFNKIRTGGNRGVVDEYAADEHILLASQTGLYQAASPTRYQDQAANIIAQLQEEIAPIEFSQTQMRDRPGPNIKGKAVGDQKWAKIIRLVIKAGLTGNMEAFQQMQVILNNPGRFGNAALILAAQKAYYKLADTLGISKQTEKIFEIETHYQSPLQGVTIAKLGLSRKPNDRKKIAEILGQFNSKRQATMSSEFWVPYAGQVALNRFAPSRMNSTEKNEMDVRIRLDLEYLRKQRYDFPRNADLAASLTRAAVKVSLTGDQSMRETLEYIADRIKSFANLYDQLAVMEGIYHLENLKEAADTAMMVEKSFPVGLGKAKMISISSIYDGGIISIKAEGEGNALSFYKDDDGKIRILDEELGEPENADLGPRTSRAQGFNTLEGTRDFPYGGPIGMEKGKVKLTVEGDSLTIQLVSGFDSIMVTYEEYSPVPPADSAMVAIYQDVDFRTTEGKRIRDALLSLREAANEGAVRTFFSRFNAGKSAETYSVEGILLWQGRIISKNRRGYVKRESDEEYMTLRDVMNKMVIAVGEYKSAIDEEFLGDGQFKFKMIGIAPKRPFDSQGRRAAYEDLQKRIVAWVDLQLNGRGDTAIDPAMLGEIKRGLLHDSETREHDWNWAIHQLQELREDGLIPQGFIGNKDPRFSNFGSSLVRAIIDQIFYVATWPGKKEADEFDRERQRDSLSIMILGLRGGLIDADALKAELKSEDISKLQLKGKEIYPVKQRGRPESSIYLDFKDQISQLSAELMKRHIIEVPLDQAMIGDYRATDFRTHEGILIKEALLSLRKAAEEGTIRTFFSRFNNTKGTFSVEGIRLWQGQIDSGRIDGKVKPELNEDYMVFREVMGKMVVAVGEYKSVIHEEFNGNGYTVKMLGIAPKQPFDSRGKRAAYEDTKRRMLAWIEFQLRGRGDTAALADPSKTATTTRGGIDLNSASMNMNIQRDGNGVPLPLNLQNLENMNIQGFHPVILNVVPITNLPLLLGMTRSEVPVESSQEKLSVADRLVKNPS
jgi:hypothetical protein